MDNYLFHGSDKIITKPDYKFNNINNDYGCGFYCTDDEELAKEWACKKNVSGYANSYNLEMDGLNILNLFDGKYTILNWIALLLKYRTFNLDTDIANDARDYLIKHFSINIDPYDIIIGYRADDSYFQYANSFVSNGLALKCLNQALYLGKLGKQIVIKSYKGFTHLHYVNSYLVDNNIYYRKYISRDVMARDTYKNDIRNAKSYVNDLFIMDILRQEITNDDPRIQQILSK